MKKLLIGCVLSVVGCAVKGQVVDLDPVTVTGSINEKKVSVTGRNILTIKSELFNKLPVNSIDELLRYLPGIEMQMRGVQGSQSDIVIRGSTFQQVLILLDGVRLNDPLTGHFNSYIPIAVAEIDRVEILKGASSAIYGSDAVGGVIHIISKAFAATLDKSDSRNSLSSSAGGGRRQRETASVIVTAGERRLLNANGGFAIQNKHTAFSTGVTSNNSDGQPQRGINGFFHNNSFSASVKQFINTHWSIVLRSSYDKRNFAAQNYYTAFVSDTATEKVSTWWNQLGVNFQKGKQDFSFTAGYKQTTDEYVFSKAAAANLNKSKLIQSQAIYTYQFNKMTSLTGGAQFINRSIVSNDRGNHTVNNYAGFIVLHQQVGSNFHISPAIRYDKELIPQLNLSYKVQKLLLRASGGKSIRDADFTERYNNYNKSLVTSGNIGNPDLDPEQAWSYEGGADYFLNSSIKISSTFFASYYSDLIDWVNTAYALMPRKTNLSPTGNYFLGSNISKLTTSGVEVDVAVQHKNLYATAGAVIVNSSSTPSLYISSHAKLLLNYSISYSYKFLQLSLNGLYKERAEQKGNAALIALTQHYYVMNAKLSASVKQFGFFVQCDNLLNKQYADRFGVAMPGRWLMGGVQFNLKHYE